MTQRDNSYGIAGEQEALVAFGQILYSKMPPNAATMTLSVRGATHARDECILRVRLVDGSTDSLPQGMELSDALNRLRAAMYRPGVGTWFSAEFSISAEGTMDAQYDYDNEPNWIHAVTAWTYADDLKHFPRDREYIPGWLQQKLDEAATES